MTGAVQSSKIGENQKQRFFNFLKNPHHPEFSGLWVCAVDLEMRVPGRPGINYRRLDEVHLVFEDNSPQI